MHFNPFWPLKRQPSQLYCVWPPNSFYGCCRLSHFKIGSCICGWRRIRSSETVHSMSKSTRIAGKFFTLTLKFSSTFSTYSWASDLRTYYTFLTFFAFTLITIQSRRSELVGRYDFIWKLQVNLLGFDLIVFICRHCLKTRR